MGRRLRSIRMILGFPAIRGASAYERHLHLLTREGDGAWPEPCRASTLRASASQITLKREQLETPLDLLWSVNDGVEPDLSEMLTSVAGAWFGRSPNARPRFRAALRQSRRKLLSLTDGSGDITFIRSWGNLGDELIYAGTRQLLGALTYREMSLRDLEKREGELALLSGGGAWCQPFHEVLPAALPHIEERFERVVILPSSFDPSVEAVRRALLATRATVFAREPVSFRLIRDLCDAGLAHDCAFFFDYGKFRQKGTGTLSAFRTDAESKQQSLPQGNLDISVTCRDLAHWLKTIAAYDVIHTDRAHVTIAAAMLGKRVRYRASSYHKVPAIARWALRGFPVEPFDEG